MSVYRGSATCMRMHFKTVWLTAVVTASSGAAAPHAQQSNREGRANQIKERPSCLKSNTTPAAAHRAKRLAQQVSGAAAKALQGAALWAHLRSSRRS
eukprot:18183-Heterococcus_DN1.PRE.2